MGSLFSKKNKNNKNLEDADWAILKLKVQRDKLTQAIERFDAVILREKHIARELLRQGKRDRAKMCLIKIKWQEKQLRATENQLSQTQTLTVNIETQRSTIDWARTVKEGTASLKELNRRLEAEDVEGLLMDTEEAQETARELQDMVGELGELGDVEDDIMAELDELEDLVADEEGLNLPTAPKTRVMTPADATADADVAESVESVEASSEGLVAV
eukprot:gnl/Dysnectes_brevis/1452_a1643_2308.p1 GENE.gnl/Dysnectes_brevis/1452_a1643_2308~~gnl/Dysnectes_brevis/1452_a1643_2308.p1  ORF type:complete len:224 (+),score=56.41 gnl/Dysnectes_brevis/1452_a1643_2308:25-672(+)